MKNKKDIINKVYMKIRNQKSLYINQDNLYSRGLAWEGYDGGYLQALSDVMLFFGGNIPNSRYEDFWNEVMEKMK